MFSRNSLYPFYCRNPMCGIPPCLRNSNCKYPPMPSEFHNREPPSPSEILKAVHGIGMDIFLNRPLPVYGRAGYPTYLKQVTPPTWGSLDLHVNRSYISHIKLSLSLFVTGLCKPAGHLSIVVLCEIEFDERIYHCDQNQHERGPV